MPHLDKQTVLDAMTGRWVEFYEQYTVLEREGGEWRGACPLHDGDGPNFTVDPEAGQWYCHSQCAEGGDAFALLQQKEGLRFGDALLKLSDFARVSPSSTSRAPQTQRPKQSASTVVATFDYVSEDGSLLYQVQRLEPGPNGKAKNFRQRRPDGLGGWIWNMDGVRRVLYRLPEVAAAVTAGKTIFLCEGEKAADALHALGVIATCNSGGEASKDKGEETDKWTPGNTEVLCGAGVVILPDNDVPGKAHAERVAAALYGKAKRLRVVALPGLPDKGDVVEWIAARGTRDDLVHLVKAAADWSPIQPPSEQVRVAVSSPVRAIRDEWPKIDEAMYYGLAGDIVRAIEPHTESDSVALLVQFLVSFGNAIGRGAHFVAEADHHYGNLYAVLVGVSSKGRKGSSVGHIKRLFKAVDPVWEGGRIQSGLSSGEGLIHSVRDPVEKMEKDQKTGQMQTVVVDEGVSDKRLLVIESEFASVLRQTQRDGNTLSPTLRNGWDGTVLQSMTKSSPARATDAHISIIGHITRDELRKDLAETETANGFGNRFLWVCARRSKELPDGGQIDNVDFNPIITRLQRVIEPARATSLFQCDSTAREIWHQVYHALSTGKPGLAGAMTGRSEAQVMRLALLYALLDKASQIRADHMTAALALWEYCEASARYIFGDSLGDRVADDTLRALRGAADGLSRTDLTKLFGNNMSGSRLSQSLSLLQEHGLARSELRKTGGAPAEYWYAVG